MSSTGEGPGGPLELSEVLCIRTKDGTELPFEVVGILNDSEDGGSYAVLMHEPRGEEEREFIVTDLSGELLEDAALAQDILDEFLVFAEEAAEDGTPEN
ncbi:MAG: hypothetical protein JO302_00420 [Candidatus Eremiobacteraeota bacterium]|nr:hypothetical protein [Candidatus Eremiobacteraeota bacterium]